VADAGLKRAAAAPDIVPCPRRSTRRLNNGAAYEFGTKQTNRTGLTMSVVRGGPEATGRRLTDAMDPKATFGPVGPQRCML
jgi:hypothetical protein